MAYLLHILAGRKRWAHSEVDPFCFPLFLGELVWTSHADPALSHCFPSIPSYPSGEWAPGSTCSWALTHTHILLPCSNAALQKRWRYNLLLNWLPKKPYISTTLTWLIGHSWPSQIHCINCDHWRLQQTRSWLRFLHKGVTKQES